MAMAGAAIFQKPEEAKEMFEQIPEELQPLVMSSLMAARATKQIGIMAHLAENDQDFKKFLDDLKNEIEKDEE
jgi:hypothetical protein